MNKLDNPSWKKFEIAVASFVKALDPSATVTHDAKLPDIHSNTIRQRDVWVEAKVCRHFPVKILISCKRKNRKLNQQDIDAFNGELISSGARLGVIYSFSGFTSNALEKGKTIGISCCMIFENEPPTIPENIVFAKSYCCTPRIQLTVVSPLDPHWNLKTWNDLFFLEFEDEGQKISAIDAIVKSYFKGEQEAKNAINNATLFPANWMRLLELIEKSENKHSIKVLIRCLWNIYEGRLEAHLLNGSYNFSSGEFIGSMSGPAIDLHGTTPGPAWKLLDRIPSIDQTKGLIRSLCILFGGNAKEALLQHLAPKPLALENIDLSKLRAL